MPKLTERDFGQYVVKAQYEGAGFVLGVHTAEEWIAGAAERWGELKYHLAQATYHARRFTQLLESIPDG